MTQKGIPCVCTVCSPMFVIVIRNMTNAHFQYMSQNDSDIIVQNKKKH